MFGKLAAALLAGMVIASPAVGQEHKTEFGVDLILRGQKASGGGDWLFGVQTPVDVRVAFHTGPTFAVEPRFTLLYMAQGSANFYTFDPGLNLLFGGSSSAYNRGGYGTIGADLAVAGGSGGSAHSIVSLNAGIGTRAPMGANATRGELFVRYTPPQDGGSSIVEIGVRIGLSFFD